PPTRRSSDLNNCLVGNRPVLFATEQLLRHIGITRARGQVEQSVRLPFRNLQRVESVKQFIDRPARPCHRNNIAPHAQLGDKLRIRYRTERLGQRFVCENRVSGWAYESRRDRKSTRLDSSHVS